MTLFSVFFTDDFLLVGGFSLNVAHALVSACNVCKWNYFVQSDIFSFTYIALCC